MALPRPVDARQEGELIAGLQAGRLDVFRLVFDTYAPVLRRFARVWTTADTAEDIVQDVLFDVWQRRDAFTVQAGSLTAYLFSAVRNRAVTHLRHQGTVRRMEENEGLLEPPGMGARPQAPDARVIEQDLRLAVDAAIARLPDVQRAVLLLRWTQGMSYERIAEVLSISANAAMLHASRARKALHPALRQLFDDSE